jgi:hypothetical protein
MIRVLLTCLALASPSRAATVTVPGPLIIAPLDVTAITTANTPVVVLGPGCRRGVSCHQQRRGCLLQ